ncbi:MAG: LptF/LptG family permease [Verrucomicrobiaceae bacterium]|nr:LptF/LptG family permease [Verrucomicrobiaceae bacterium]
MFTRIFDRYIGRQIYSGTLNGFIVLSAVFVLGTIFKKLDQILGDTELPATLVIHFIGLVIPSTLVFTIPGAFLTAILLSFGRMSADNELVSIRMSGTSMPRICLPVFLIAFMLSALCFWVNTEVTPDAKNKIKRLFRDVTLDNPASLFQPGKVLEKFPGFRIYTGKREDNEMRDLTIIELEGSRSKRVIRAKKATLVTTPGVLDFVLELKDAVIEVPKTTPGVGVENIDFIRFKETQITFPLSRLKEKTERVKADMKSTPSLWEELRTGVSTVNGTALDKRELSLSRTELSKRYSLSLVCMTFVLVGIPLGITAQRRETSVGFLISLVVAVSYYAFVILAEQMSDNPAANPHVLMWLPNIIFMSIGGWLFFKLTRK